MKKNIVYDVVLASMLLCLLIVGSKLTIPLGFISLTMQLPVVFLIIFLVKRKIAVMVIATYIIMGLIGIPVFSTGGGISYIYQPSFGFIIGFLLAALIAPKVNGKIRLILSILVVFLAVYLTGIIYMYVIFNYYMNKDFGIIKVLQIGVYPFILKDIICAYLASVIAYRLKKYLSYNYIFNDEVNI